MVLFLAIIYLATRIFLVCRIEEMWPSLEQFYVGTIAKEVADGMVLPLWDYQFSSYEAGQLFSAIVGFPLIKALGFTTFSLAFCAILTHLGEFVLLYLMLQKYISKRVAILFGVQFILAPYFFHSTSVVYAFNYFNVGVLYMLFLMLFWRIFRQNRIEGWWGNAGVSLFVLGLLGGLSTWITFTFLLIVVPCFVYWVFYQRTFDMRKIGPFIGGFALGISPVVFRIAQFAGEVKVDVVDRLGATGPLAALGKFSHLLLFETNRQLSLYGNVHELLSVGLFIAIVVMRWDYLKGLFASLFSGKIVPDDGNGKVLVICLYPLTFFAVYGLSNFSDMRYMVPVYPFVFACNAIAIDMMLRQGNKWGKKAAYAIMVALIVLCVADSSARSLYQVPPNLKLFRDRGYSYELLGSLVSWRFKGDPRRVMKIFHRLSDGEKQYALLRGFAFELAIEDDGIMIPGYINYLAEFYHQDVNLLRAFNKGLVLGYGQQYFEDTQFGEFYPALLRPVSEQDALRYFKRSAALIDYEQEQARPDCILGLGIQFSAISGDLGLDPESVERFFEEKHRRDFREGIELGTKYAYRI